MAKIVRRSNRGENGAVEADLPFSCLHGHAYGKDVVDANVHDNIKLGDVDDAPGGLTR
jgi:hypothetical protein